MTDYPIDTEYLKDDRSEKYLFIYLSAERYLSVLRKHRRTDSTLRTYRSALNVLCRAIVDLKGCDATLEDISEEDIYDLMVMLNGKESTVKTRIGILGGWMEFEIGVNLPRKLKLLWNSSEPDRVFITKAQYEKILSSARNGTERLIIEFGSQMGLRMNEISHIRMDDIDGDHLTIKGKGHGDGKVVRKEIPRGLMDSIADYCYGERERLLRKSGRGSSDRLLLQNTRNHPSGIPITNGNIIEMYRRISRETGIRVTSHVMRRLYCTILAEDVGLRSDLDTLRRMMRHESIDTTLSCYLNVNGEKMHEAQEMLDEVFKSL